MITLTPTPFAELANLIRTDPEYAWAFHCNLAVPIWDVTRCTHTYANQAAALIMRQMFDHDITTHQQYEYGKSAVQAHYEMRIEAERAEGVDHA